MCARSAWDPLAGRISALTVVGGVAPLGMRQENQRRLQEALKRSPPALRSAQSNDHRKACEVIGVDWLLETAYANWKLSAGTSEVERDNDPRFDSVGDHSIFMKRGVPERATR